MSLGQIIRTRREELKLTLDEVSSMVNFSKPYLSTIETGKVKNPPSDELLIKLEKILEFEQGSLLHIAHMERLPSDIRQNYEIIEAENKKFRSLFKNLVDVKDDAEKVVSLLSLNSSKTEQVHETSLAAGSLVPVINKESSGYPADFNNFDYLVSIADDYIRCPDLHDPGAFAVRIIDDSMETKFANGNIVVFSPAAQVRNGDDCFIHILVPGGTTIKRVFFEQDNKVRLQPRNEKYSPVIMEGSHIKGLYRAIMKFEKL